MADRVVSLKITADPSSANRAGRSLVTTFDKVAQDIDRKIGQIGKLGSLRQGVAEMAAQADRLRDKLRDVSGSVINANQAASQLDTLRKVLDIRERIAAAEARAAGPRARYETASQAGIQGVAPTRAQAAELFRAADAANKAERAVAALRAEEQALSRTLVEAGVNLADVAGEQRRLALDAAQIRPLTTQYQDLTAQLRSLGTVLSRDAAAADKLSTALRADGVSTGPGAAAELEGRVAGQRLVQGIADAARAKQGEATKAAVFIIQQAARAAEAKAQAERARVSAAAQNLFGGIAEAARAIQVAPVTLGFRPSQDIQREIAQVREALAVYRQLRNQGQVSFRDMSVAAQSARARIASLRAEMGGVLGRLTAIRAAAGGGGRAGAFGAVGANLGGLVGLPGLAGGVAASYAGGEFIQGSVKTALNFEGIERALTAVTGSALEAQESLAFVRAEAERLALPLEPAADGFKRLAASANGSGIELATVKELFSALSTAASALGLDQDRLQGIFEAFGQIMSKGKVQAEELRGQLGDRLYGAFSLAARGMGISTQALDEMLKEGKLAADVFIRQLIPVLLNDFGAAAKEASDSARGSFNRLQTAWTELKLEFARSGLLDDLADGAQALTARFKDPEFVESIRTLGRTIGAFSQFLVTHGDTLFRLLSAAAGAKVGAALGSVAGVPGAAAGALIGGAAGYFAPDLLGAASSDEQIRRTETAAQEVARLQAEIQKLAETYGRLKELGAESEGPKFLAEIQKKADRLRELQGIRDTVSPALGGGAAGGDEKAEKLARKLREDGLAHFRDVLDEENKRLEEQADLKRRLTLDTLAAEGKDTAAALAGLQDEYDEFLKGLGDSAEGLNLAHRWFNASEAQIALEGIRARAEKELAAIESRIAARDRRSEFVDAAERRRLQEANAHDVAEAASVISGAEASAQVFGGASNEAFNEFIASAKQGVDDLGQSILRATEGPIERMFRTWRDGTQAMQEAGADWIKSTVDGIAQLAVRGKADFRGLAESIIEDIIRIQLQSLVAGFASSATGQAVSGFIGNLFGGSQTGAVDFANQDPFGAVQYKAGGGFVSGPGTSTSDSIAAMLSNGEFVINARAVRMFGRDMFEGLNRGFLPPTRSLPRFAAGGYVGSGAGGVKTAGEPVVQILNYTGAPVREQTRPGPNGQPIKQILIGALQEDIAQNGPMSRMFQRAYGLKNPPSIR